MPVRRSLCLLVLPTVLLCVLACTSADSPAAAGTRRALPPPAHFVDAGGPGASRAAPGLEADAPQDAPVPADAGSGLPGEAFAPAAPAADESDWLRLSSGEWLRGKVLSLRAGSLQFSSKKLSSLTLDWGAVDELRSPRQQTVLLENGESFLGPVLVRDGTAWLAGGAAARDRAELLSIVPGNAVDEGLWSGKLSAGFTARSGNTQQKDVSAFAFLRRETAATRFDTRYNGAYSKVEGLETANNHRLRSNLDWFFSRRLFLTPVGLDVFRDPFQNVAVRVTPYSALGYEIFDSGPVTWEVSGGPAFVHTRFESVEPGEDRSDDTAAAIASTKFAWDVSSMVDFQLSYDLTMPIPETTSFNHHLVAQVSVDLIADFDLDLSLVWDRVNAPPENDTGLTPEQDDFRVSVGLGWTF